MFNGVSHAYRSARSEKVTEATEHPDDAMEPDIARDELNADDKAIEAAMEGMTFGDEGVDEEVENVAVDEFGPLWGHKCYCVKNIWKKGWESIGKMNVKEVRKHKAARQKRKRALAKHVLKKVTDMRSDSANVDVGSEMNEVDPAPWTEYVHSLRPNIY